MAAGDTPSPRLVADAPVEGSLKPAVAAGLFAAVVLGAVLCGWLGGRSQLSARTPLRDTKLEVMRYKAEAVLVALGYDEPAKDSAYRYYTDREYIRHVQEHDPSPGRWDGLAGGRPPAVLFFYRTARDTLAPLHLRDTIIRVGPMNPPPLDPGMADVSLDLNGRLLGFHKVADFRAPAEPPPAGALDWRPAFAAAGLDYEAFTASPMPRHCPPLATDARFAWEGPYPDRFVNRVRVEAAALGSKPVYFAIEFPWQGDDRTGAYFDDRLGEPGLGWLFLRFGLPLVALVLAWWNWRAGRADVRGAVKVGGAMFGLAFLAWVLDTRHLADIREQILFELGLGISLFDGITFGIYYAALEPVVRKRWPWRLVSWNRLLAGRVRDPLLARDVLVGLVGGAASALVVHAMWGSTIWPGEPPIPIGFADWQWDPSVAALQPVRHGIAMGLRGFFLIFVLHWVCRNRWLGVAAVTAAVVGVYAPVEPRPVSAVLAVGVVAVGLQLVALRFGLLSLVSANIAFAWLNHTNWTLDMRAWFATGPNLAVGLLIAFAGWAAYTATGGRLFGEGFHRGG